MSQVSVTQRAIEVPQDITWDALEVGGEGRIWIIRRMLLEVLPLRRYVVYLRVDIRNDPGRGHAVKLEVGGKWARAKTRGARRDLKMIVD